MTATVTFEIDGQQVTAPAGVPLAAILHDRSRPFRHSPGGAPRGLYCGMGVCLECQVEVNGRPVRSCMEPVRDDMVVQTGGNRS
jgi:aerobic-type carbon monoxide dehydrogenase small subunit (CoxS/CutS family)